MKHLITFSLALASTSLAAAPCLAVETGGAPVPLLPPPPPRAPLPAPPPAPPPGPPKVAAADATPPPQPVPEKDATDDGPHALDTRPFLAPLLGYLSDYLDFGIGLRGGKTFENHVYIGGTFVYQIGEAGGGSVVTTLGTSSYSWSSSGFYIGPEAGYDFDLKYVVVRPYMGLGIFDWTSSASGPGGGASASSAKLVVWPGGTVIWNVPESNYFLGGDLRLVSVPGTAFGLYAMAGMHFGA